VNRFTRPTLGQDLRSSEILCSVQGPFITDVSGQPIGPMFKGQEIQEDFDILTLEDENDRLSRNIGKELPL
jgi:hypothetical protein